MDGKDPVKRSESPMLLTPKGVSLSDFIVPGIIGVTGVAVLYSVFNKKSSRDASSHIKLNPSDDDVLFSKNYSSYSIGKNWETLVLEPYLAEQVEEGHLIAADSDESFLDAVEGALDAAMESTRESVLSAFKLTHSVSSSDGRILISNLPTEKSGVQKFYEWLASYTKKFQEEY